MSKCNDDFFVKKSEWAEVKDALLDHYLTPYIAKILNTNKPLLYVDCFAGKGRFNDGKDGSPVIACRNISERLAATHSKRPKVFSYFVEKYHAGELETNLQSFDSAKVVASSFEDIADELISSQLDCNLFLYVDPYGIKSLNMQFFDKLPENFSSVEVLLNLNSFGFFRDACRAYGVEYSDVGGFDDMVEYESDDREDVSKSTSLLTKVAGGDFWKEIVFDYRRGIIDGYAAERRFAEEFCLRMSKNYRFVQNLPVRIKEGNRPKYRMIHATNHPAGCILMNDNMCGRKEILHSIQHSGQMSLFTQTAENEMVDDEKVSKDLLEHCSNCESNISIDELLASFIVEKGMTLPTGDLRKMIRGFEEQALIQITREPPFTESGKPSRFMNCEKHKKVYVRSAR